MLDVKTRLSLLFDSNTFPLLRDAAYLIFRYLSKDFQNIGDKDIHSTLFQLKKLVPDSMIRIFHAHGTYLPCGSMSRPSMRLILNA